MCVHQWKSSRTFRPNLLRFMLPIQVFVFLPKAFPFCFCAQINRQWVVDIVDLFWCGKLDVEWVSGGQIWAFTKYDNNGFLLVAIISESVLYQRSVRPHVWRFLAERDSKGVKWCCLVCCLVCYSADVDSKGGQEGQCISDQTVDLHLKVPVR